MTLQRLLLSSLCVCVLAACGGTEALGEEEGLVLRTSEAAEEGDPGWPMQGTQLHGSNLTSASFTGAMLNGVAIQNLHLEQGELVGSVPLTISRTTPSMQACTSSTTGIARSCGFTSMGVGTCTPGTSVTLGGGACGLGACTGDTAVRVCEGTLPCEHSSTTRLVSGNDACGSFCSSVQFTCPVSGIYNVLAGPYVSSGSWSVKLVPDSGKFPGSREVRGTELRSATLSVVMGGVSTVVLIDDVINASQLHGPFGELWDATGETFLYHLVRPLTSGSVEVCASHESNPNWQWAVPMSGVFDASNGVRHEEAGRFTFGCDSAVIAKCYRWGYKSWREKQGENEPDMGQLHAACTRMARADYCGNGESFTLDGTPIHPWDTLPTAIRQHGPDTPKAFFEAGWQDFGAVCLSKTRWEQLKPLPAECPLVAPGWIVPGAPGVQCPPGQRWDDTLNKPCATVCNSAEEAQAYSPSIRLFNESHYNSGP
ncbi:ADYC domain-containing protein [Hyalangium versicolor]|uniref:ADYC domain-containing protein n=1 Tax=Hyalangium versicolor TaxID=2861190 RepID=UPI001CCF5032|nr:ADYC domain-containing protein [Hyalangium versicolor]